MLEIWVKMTPFEYVSVLTSIILGLGVTQILTGIADLLNQWEKVKLYWPHLLWVVLVFVLHIQEWWITYQLHTIESWRLPIFLFFILVPVNLFILARILFPFNLHEEVIDLKVFYYRNFRKFFLWTMILNVLSIITNLIVDGIHADQLVIVAIFATLGWVSWRNYQMEWLHKMIVVSFLVLLIASVIVNWDNWLIA